MTDEAPPENPGDDDSGVFTSQTLEPDVQVRPRDEIREYGARIVAGLLMLSLVATVIGCFGLAFNHQTQDAVELSQILIPALTALVGTVLGYYFASRS